MKSRVKCEMDKQLIYIASLLIIVGKTRPDYQTMVKSRSNCFIISGCCVITGTGSNMVRHFGHYEMLCNTPYLRPNRMLCNRFHGGRHLGTTGTTRLKTNALYYCLADERCVFRLKIQAKMHRLTLHRYFNFILVQNF